MDLERKLQAGDFVILAEMEPPKGCDLTQFISNSRKVKGNVDAFLIPEMSNAVMRMSALGASLVLQNNGMETVMQVCCRDRNRLALQADLLAAAACGVGNVMAVTGEDPSFGDHHETRAVYDIDLPDLLDTIHSLQNGRDMAGIDLAGSPSFLVGSTVNATAKGSALDLEMDDMKAKIAAGVRFFITPPLFDRAAIEPFLKRIEHLDIYIIPTVLLLKSLGMARYLDRHMDHIHIPDHLISRIQKAPDKVGACLDIARETISLLKDKPFSGVLLSTIGWENRLPEILQGI
jgi:methylenetetrahydrofolate reductase (NADH)